MKNFKTILFAFVLFTAFFACKNETKTATPAVEATEATAPVEALGAEHTSAYVCPMHCEGSGSAEAGTCPVCEMDYVLNEDHHGDGHSH